MRVRDLVARLLPADEWPKVQATGMCLPLAQAAAHQGDVIVIERGDQIVGCWVLMTLFHADGVWIDPGDSQRTAIGRRLWRAMKEIAQWRGARAAWVTTVDPMIGAMAAQHGATAIPGAQWVFPLEA